MLLHMVSTVCNLRVKLELIANKKILEKSMVLMGFITNYKSTGVYWYNTDKCIHKHVLFWKKGLKIANNSNYISSWVLFSCKVLVFSYQERCLFSQMVYISFRTTVKFYDIMDLQYISDNMTTIMFFIWVLYPCIYIPKQNTISNSFFSLFKVIIYQTTNQCW